MELFKSGENMIAVLTSLPIESRLFQRKLKMSEIRPFQMVHNLYLLYHKYIHCQILMEKNIKYANKDEGSDIFARLFHIVFSANPEGAAGLILLVKLFHGCNIQVKIYENQSRQN